MTYEYIGDGTEYEYSYPTKENMDELTKNQMSIFDFLGEEV